MYVVNAIKTIDGLLTIGVVTGLCDAVQTTPCVRDLVRTDVDRVIGDMIGLMDIEREAVDAVASVDVRQSAAIIAGDGQRIGVAALYTVLHPRVYP